MLNLWMSWEILFPNLSFTVENKMGNSHKRGWSHFKLNINDWDIPFPKILRIYQWIGKNIFHWGKWNEPIKLIRECVRLKIKIWILVAAKRLWGHSKSIFTQNWKFSTCSPLFIPVHFTCRLLMKIWIKNWGVKRKKRIIFYKLNINVFYTDICMITTIKIFRCSYLKKSLKKCLRLFNKTFNNYQATY